MEHFSDRVDLRIETTTAERLVVHRITSERSVADFAADVRVGLLSQPKILPPKYFYDELGSVLFEAICLLPEYYVARAERQIIEARAREVRDQLRPPFRLVELGSGNASKTRLLIEAVLERQPKLEYVAIDISASALEETAKDLLGHYPRLNMTCYAATYEDALGLLAQESPVGQATLVAFLGSSIGNLDPSEAVTLLHSIRSLLRPGDALLLGADLVKAETVLIPAYDDPLGVTAAFNLNVLARINRELGGHFDLTGFRHRAVFNRELSRIEMHAESRVDQEVEIANLNLTVAFKAGESIHTESSYKFTPNRIEELAALSAFEVSRIWQDSDGQFALSLLIVGDSSLVASC